MCLSLILSIVHTMTIGTMLNNGYGIKKRMCKQKFQVRKSGDMSHLID